MVSAVWAGSYWLEMACLCCSGNCRCMRMGGEKKSTRHRLLSLFYSFTRRIFLKRILGCFCFVAGPILFPYPTAAVLELKVSFSPARPQVPHCFLSSALSLNNNSPWIRNSVSQSKTQKRILSPLPLHVFKKGKTAQRSSKMTGPLFEPNAGTSPFA